MIFHNHNMKSNTFYIKLCRSTNHSTLCHCFMPVVLHLFCLNIPCQLTLFQFPLSHFQFNALWLVAFYYANNLFLMGISFFICTLFSFRPTFSGKQLRHKVKAGCFHPTGGQNTFVWNIFFILKIANTMQQTFNVPPIKI